MVFVSDPDDLDRFQVALDPDQETIEITGLGTPRTPIHEGGDTTNTDGTTFVDNSTDVQFITDGVTAGDILAIVTGTGGVIGHYPIASVPTENEVQVEAPGFVVQATGLVYRIFSPTVVDGPAGGNVGDGVSLQALYSFLKEEWRTLSDARLPDLIRFTFPFESITREQFELGGTQHGDWDFKDNDTRNLIRTGGWAQIDSAGVTQSEYSGIITLGTLDANAQVYYLQEDGGTPTPFVLPGAVNQAIRVFDNSSGGFDFRSFLNIFVRKKAKSYAQSEIADIGVTQLETIVNRFPLTHTADPAISLTDGEISGDGTAGTQVFQAMTTVDATATDGVVADADTTDGVFELSSAASTFQTDGLQPRDTVEFTDGSNQGVYEIVSVDSENGLTLKQEPQVGTTAGEFVAVTPEGGTDFTTRTRVRSAEKTDGSLSPLTSGEGTLTSASADFVTDGVVAGDMVLVTAGTAAVIGAYKVLSRDSANELTLDTSDQPFSGESAQTFTVVRAGMHLQFKDEVGSTVNPTVTFDDADATFSGSPPTIVRSAGSWLTDSFVIGGVVTVTGAANSANNGTFAIVDIDTDTNPNDALILASTAGIVDEASVAINATPRNGFIRTLNQQQYSSNWRLFGNGATLSEAFQFIQKDLRRGRGLGELEIDIDAGSPITRGDTADLLMSFASPNGVGLNMFIDDLSSTELNNATFNDITGTGRNFAFIAGVTINVNQNILDDIPGNGGTNKIVVFFATNPAGDFESEDAVIVQDQFGVDMVFEDQSTSPISTTFDYDNNAQGGRTPGTDAGVVIVAIGEETAQYVQVTGTIQRVSANTFSLVAALERNFANP